METLVVTLPSGVVIALCLTVGLAPHAPPHFYEKLLMFFRGHLVRPIDWFDLFFHVVPWLLLVLKAMYSFHR